MSQLLAILDVTGRAIEDRATSGPLRALQAGDGSELTHHRSASALVAVVRYDWELDAAFGGDVLVLEEGDLVVAADASLYYCADLERALCERGTRAGGKSASHLIAAAYRTWGDELASHLEGDFAFVILDRASGRLVCARDILGLRTLYYARIGAALVVSTSVKAILAHPDCPSDLNPAAIAASATGTPWATGADTCYAAISALPSASTLVWAAAPGRDAEPRIARHWDPPAQARAPSDFETGAAELLALLEDAVSERMAPAGPTAVWMSGGWDSTSVFAAGQSRVRRDGSGRLLRPVSISYPEGDLGREDELIEQISEHWRAPVHWLDIDEIPLFAGLEARTLQREQPAAPLYERWNLALAEGTRDVGARVALDGNGGDQLFRVSDIFLSDLLRSGRWLSLARELRARPGAGLRYGLSTVLKPALPPAAARLAGALRGRELGHYIDRPIMPWMRGDFVERCDLVERERANLPPAHGASRERAELEWYVTCSFPGYAMEIHRRNARACGVELRSPLLDRRIVELALSRPREERAYGAETKRLLRRAMSGLLPETVLAPRPFRTGVTTSYSTRSMQSAYPKLFDRLFQSPLLLEEMGVIDAEVLRTSVSKWEREGGEFLRVGLFHVLQTELWLRAQLRTASPSVDSSPKRGDGWATELSSSSVDGAAAVTGPCADQSSEPRMQ
jgi:asparagine synthase (glutamine-hydrolysing)